MFFITHKQTCLKAIVLASVLFLQLPAWAADGPPPQSSMDNLLTILLVVIAGILLIVIATLAHTVLGAAAYYHEKEKEPAKGNSGVIPMLIGLLLVSNIAFAQAETTAEVATATNYGGMTATAFYILMSVIFLEVLVIVVLLINLRILVAKERKRIAVMNEATGAVEYQVAKPTRTWWDKVNSFRPIKEEAALDLGHDYDGIRELDNRLPPWWLYGFYVSIVFAGIYLYRYHVKESAPLSSEEFAIAMKQAEAQKEAYLKKAANKVDETTVKLLTGTGELASGKTVYTNNCVACHGQNGEGGVGPNLTDDYWLAGGSVQDVFKTIKYGRQEKGMRSWKDDLSPMQIAQVASYIKSLHGTTPAKGKEPQGELYKEDTAAPADSTAKDNKTAAN
ncbi:MAG: cbb3-type cytochrome c oxidase N-terminal domain-containing protein [Flavihumibacter sp.]|nr:cbb3-type cytochrome c oxidase N-terminal domain-containing protein [Flavihumibacter sp.]